MPDCLPACLRVRRPDNWRHASSSSPPCRLPTQHPPSITANMPGKDQGRDKERASGGHTSHKQSRHHHHHHHEESRHHKSSHHHAHGGKHSSDHHKSKTTHHHGGKKGAEPRANRHDPESGRHPSSSAGPGVVEPVLLLLITIIGISALVMLSLGIWLLAVKDGWPSGLNNTGSVFWTRFISYATACILLAVFFILIVIIAMCAAVATNGSKARKLRLSLIFLLSFASLLLLLMIVTALLFATSGPSFINQVLVQSWKNTVKDDDNILVACDIQKRFSCQGWDDDSCKNCAPTISGEYSTPKGTCHPHQRDICPRCWTYSSTSEVNKPVERRGIDVDDFPFEIPISVNSGIMMKARQPGRQVQQPNTQSSQQTDVLLGCRRFIEWRNREFFIPMVVYTIFLLLVMLLLSWKTCIDSSGRR